MEALTCLRDYQHKFILFFNTIAVIKMFRRHKEILVKSVRTHDFITISANQEGIQYAR